MAVSEYIDADVVFGSRRGSRRTRIGVEGYCYEEKVEAVTKRLHSPAEKIRMLLIWSTPGNLKMRLTMARMASRSQQETEMKSTYVTVEPAP